MTPIEVEAKQTQARAIGRPTHDSSDAAQARRQAPGRGCCFRCGFPWGAVSQHVTDYRTPGAGRHGQGCFPLCQGCWEALTPGEREPYYWTLIRTWEVWHRVSEEDAFDIIAAVRSGL